MRPVEVGSSFPGSRALKTRKGVCSKQLCCEHKRVPKIRRGVCSKRLMKLGSAQSSTAGCWETATKRCSLKTGKDCLGRGARPLRGRLGLRGTRLGPLGLGLRGLGGRGARPLPRLRLVAAKHLWRQLGQQLLRHVFRPHKVDRVRPAGVRPLRALGGEDGVGSVPDDLDGLAWLLQVGAPS